MNVNFLLVLLFDTGLSLTAPAWPTFWSANWDFVSENNANDILEQGLWYYNVTTSPGLLRQDNDIDCPIPQFNQSCRAIFKNNNVYLYNPDMNNLCCQCWNDVPPTQPNWLVDQSKSDGTTEYRPLNAECTKWTFQSTHYYYANVNNSYPVAEAGGGSTLQWWNINTMSSAFDISVFDIPSDCTTGCNELFGEKVKMPKSLATIQNLQQFHCGL